MSPKEERTRFLIVGAVVAAIVLAFLYQLVFIQITQGEAYKRKVTQGYTRTQTVVAARGEIVDRYGRPFTINRVSLDIILDQAYLPEGQTNEVIVELITLLESLDQDWIDNLPIGEPSIGSDGAPHYQFLPGTETQAARLKSDLGIAAYATADDCMKNMCSPAYYDLDPRQDDKPGEREWALDPAIQRKLAGVRYEMAQQNFGYKNNYTFARDVSNLVATNVQERSFALPGVDVIQSTVREFSDGTIAPHIVGITGPLYREDMESLREQGLWWSEDNQQGYRPAIPLGAAASRPPMRMSSGAGTGSGRSPSTPSTRWWTSPRRSPPPPGAPWSSPWTGTFRRSHRTPWRTRSPSCARTPPSTRARTPAPGPPSVFR